VDRDGHRFGVRSEANQASRYRTCFHNAAARQPRGSLRKLASHFARAPTWAYASGTNGMSMLVSGQSAVTGRICNRLSELMILNRAYVAPVMRIFEGACQTGVYLEMQDSAHFFIGCNRY